MTSLVHNKPWDGDKDRVEKTLVATAYRALPAALLVNLVNGLLVIVVLRDHSPAPYVWLGTLLFSVAVRTCGLYWYRRLDVVQFHLQETRFVAYAGTLLSGLVWGSAAVLMWPAESVGHQSFLIMVLAGMVAGSISTLASLRWGVLVFLIPTLTPFILRFTTNTSDSALPMAMMIALFGIMIGVTARRTYDTLRYGFETRFAREYAEARIEHQALYDELTDLPNRRLFMDRLDRAIARARDQHRAGAVLFMDLDGFKRINDSVGHHVGDDVLGAVADRLRGRLRETDIVARLGGDEFVALLPELGANVDQAAQVGRELAEEVTKLLATPILAGGHEIRTTVSIGVAAYPVTGEETADTLKNADTAMYHAKKRGRDTVEVFTRTMQEAVHRHMEVERDLRYALLREQFAVHYQPQVNINNRIVGLEALVRWEKPGCGLVAPGSFIRVAEKSGLIFELQTQIMDHVCRDIKHLARSFAPGDMPRVAINLSPREFHRSGFVTRIEEHIRKNEIEPQWMCLEITESTAMERVDEAVRKMTYLRDLGLHFAIDDFGTGYSSLAYLKYLPIDSLKIDRSFVRDILTDANDAIIVRTILAMSEHLGIPAVAEGVESEPVAAFLRENGCQFFQGWLYGKARPLEHCLSQVLERAKRSEDYRQGWQLNGVQV